MALPTQLEVLTLDFSLNGIPFVKVEAKTLNTLSLDYSFLGLPFVGIGPGGTPPVTYNSTQFFMVF